MQIKVKDLNLTSYDKVVLLIKDTIKKKKDCRENNNNMYLF